MVGLPSLPRTSRPLLPRNPNRNAKHHSRSQDAVIRVYDAAGNVIETHEHARDFKEW